MRNFAFRKDEDFRKEENFVFRKDEDFRKDEHFTFRKDEHFACWGWTLFCLHCLNWAADARAVLLCHRSWHRLMCSEITFWFVWPLEIVPCDPALAQCPSVHLGTVTFGFHHRPVVTMSPSTQHPENPTLSLWNFLYFLFYYTFPTLARSVGVLLQTEVKSESIFWLLPSSHDSSQKIRGANRSWQGCAVPIPALLGYVQIIFRMNICSNTDAEIIFN